MKTELEWIEFEEKNPSIEGANGRNVLIETAAVGVLFVCSNELIENLCFNLEIKKYSRWAYVNLPEEEDKLYISEIKIPVNCTVNFDKSIPGTDKTVTTLANKEKETIRRSHEFRNYPLDDEGWIWPLKQLPEDGQEVEVKHLDGEENKTFFIGKTFRGGKDIAAPPYYIDVIAWRPLREAKLEDRKPDFSKLREGDLIVIEYKDGIKIIGFIQNITPKNDYIHFELNGCTDYSLEEFNFDTCDIDDMKKIIRINIDEPKNVVQYYGIEIDDENFKAFKVEEI